MYTLKVFFGGFHSFTSKITEMRIDKLWLYICKYKSSITHNVDWSLLEKQAEHLEIYRMN